MLLWLLYNLGRLPEIQAKLFQEIDKAVGNEICITAKHVAKMPYLKACVKESLRYLIPILVYSINLGILADLRARLGTRALMSSVRYVGVTLWSTSKVHNKIVKTVCLICYYTLLVRYVTII